jgi:very-short-patch-repair endonuclease
VVVLSSAMPVKGQPHSQARGVGLAALGTKQHGVVSIRQLLGPLGYSEAGVAEAVGSGRLHPLQRGVYAVGHTDLSARGECLAAVLAVGPGSLLSYWSAGWLHGVLHSSLQAIHVTATGPRRLRVRPPVRVHRARNLVAVDRELVDGIPVTSLARTLLDVSERTRGERLPKMLERADKAGKLDLQEVYAVCDRSRGHRGAKPLRRAASLYRPTARLLRSDLERDFLALVRAARLPLPATNFVVEGNELDAYWTEHELAVELDTYATHGSRRQFEADRKRDAELAAAGIATIRITDRQLEEDPGAVARRLERMLRPGAVPRRRAWRTSRV